MVHLVLQVFHVDFFDDTLRFCKFNRLIASCQFSVDVHAINAFTFTDLNTHTDIFQSLIVLLKQKVFVRLKVNHNLVVLPFFNLLHGMR